MELLRISKKNRYFFCIIILLIFCVGPYGCDQIKVVVTGDKITQSLAGRFPLKKYYLSYTVTYDSPSINIHRNVDEVTLRMAASITRKAEDKMIDVGSFVVEMKPTLKYVEETGEIYFNESMPVITDKKISSDSPDSAEEAINKTIASLSSYISQEPFYSLPLKSNEVNKIINRFELKEIRMREGYIILRMMR